MKICIDVSPIVYGTGVSLYTKQLVNALLQIDKKNEYILLGGSLRQYSNLKKLINEFKGKYSKKVFPLPPIAAHYLWNIKHKYPIERIVGKIQVFHASDWAQPPTQAFKVTTIHDLVPLRFPNMSDRKIIEAHKAKLEWVKKEADVVIAVSEFTKREIIDLLKINPKKIVVIPEAPDPTLKKSSQEEIDKTLNKYKVRDKFLLMVGADPRKNINQTLEGYQLVKKNHPNLSIVITGRPWKPLPKIEGVILTGYISREELVNLYSSAEALVYPSLYEGFGLPILEAMKLGCPVVTSNLSSMPEVAGRAAVLVNPKDFEDIAKGIEKVLSDRVLWINRGKKRAKEFSWIDTAEKTLKVYKGAIK